MSASPLYAFLELPQTCTLATLRSKSIERVEELKSSGVSKPNTSMSQSYAELAAICSGVFETEARRARYDESMRRAGLEKVIEQASVNILSLLVQYAFTPSMKGP